jgi:hypothetical protein
VRFDLTRFIITIRLMSNWLGRIRIWAAPAVAGGLFLLALIFLGQFNPTSALLLAIVAATLTGLLLVIERK